MRAQLINDAEARTYALIFDTDDEVIAGLETFAREHQIAAAHFSAIGAFRRATLGYFDWTGKDYERIEIDEQVEVLSLIGDIALKGTEPKVHAHVVVGKRDGSAHGGHLLTAQVRPTLEVVLTDTPAHLCRVHDEQSGLALIRIDDKEGFEGVRRAGTSDQ